MANETIVNGTKTFWEELIGIDLFKNCTELESKIKENHLNLLGNVRPDVKVEYRSNQCLFIELFTHDHLPLYQQLRAQLSYLAELITSLRHANVPINTVLRIEKEYQALNLFLMRKEFLEIYQKNQESFETCKAEMVQWHNKLVIKYGREIEDYYQRMDLLTSLKKRDQLQRKTLVTILYEAKTKYEHYLQTHYKSREKINQKWYVYFGGLVWKEGAHDIFDLNGGPLSTFELWQRIETIFLLSKRPFYIKDSPIKNFLTTLLHRLQSGAAIAFNPKLKRYELIHKYDLQYELVYKSHCAIMERIKSQPNIKNVASILNSYRKRISELKHNVKKEEALLIELVSSRVIALVKESESKVHKDIPCEKSPTLLVNSLLCHLFRHYSSIVGYLYGISRAVDFWDKRDIKNKIEMEIEGTSGCVPFCMKEIFELVDSHKKKIATIEANPRLSSKAYSIHLEKIAFCEALFEFTEQYHSLSLKSLPPLFFSGDTMTQRFFEHLFNLTSFNLSDIDVAVAQLHKFYRMTQQMKDTTLVTQPDISSQSDSKFMM